MTGYATDVNHSQASQAALLAESKAMHVFFRSQPCYSGASMAFLSCLVRLTRQLEVAELTGSKPLCKGVFGHSKTNIPLLSMLLSRLGTL